MPFPEYSVNAVGDNTLTIIALYVAHNVEDNVEVGAARCANVFPNESGDAKCIAASLILKSLLGSLEAAVPCPGLAVSLFLPSYRRKRPTTGAISPDVHCPASFRRVR